MEDTGKATDLDLSPELPAKYGFSEWQPRLWHGMTLGAWLSIVRGNVGKIALRRYPLAATITIVASVNTLISLVLKAIYARSISRTNFEEEPVFVLGYWRSGTTWLHELMTCDPHHCCPTTIQCIAPEVFPFLGAMKRLFGNMMPGKRPMDGVALSWDSPQEDEIAMLNLGYASPYRFLAFPSGGWRDLTGYWPKDQDELDRWGARWLRFLREIQYFHLRKRLVLKSPAHTARIETILKCFPNAKFIHIARDPEALFRSNLKSNRAMVATQSLEFPIRLERDEENMVVELHKQVYGNFFPEADKLYPGQICYLRYEDLQRDPVGQVRRVYAELGLTTINEALPALSSFCQKHKNYLPQRHELDAGTKQLLREEWQEYFKRFGYA